MRKTITYCDICGAEGAVEVSFITDRVSDPAGSREDQVEYADLCVNHAPMPYKIAELELSYKQREAIYLKLRSRFKK